MDFLPIAIVDKTAPTATLLATRRLLDSADICQSVLGSFFFRAAGGQYDLNEPSQLIRLLVVMARNKLNFQIRKQRAQRRYRLTMPHAA